ncbi:hypothetical protein XENOCAPTIV_001488 [Xenoophorus captivus]|uniref:Uncharacterized protein n=1 Tax=Xenoophorus captivus TaxID=1517983 RepID=A0ABV0RWN3_9TELE
MHQQLATWVFLSVLKYQLQGRDGRGYPGMTFSDKLLHPFAFWELCFDSSVESICTAEVNIMPARLHGQVLQKHLRQGDLHSDPPLSFKCYQISWVIPKVHSNDQVSACS